MNNSRGRVYVNAGGTATNISANLGNVFLAAGGSALNVDIKDNANLYLDVTAATVLTGTSHGKAVQVKDNVISNISIRDGRKMHVVDGWTAYDSFVADWYSVINVYSGGKAIRTEIGFESELIVSNGGYAGSAIVNNSRGRMYVQAGGTASDIKVDLGTLTVYKGGKITGEMKFSKNGKVVASAGSIVDFDISNRSASKGFLLSDYSVISGAPNFTITVANMQRGGEYKLADYADKFNSVITVGNGEYDFGTLQVGGSTLTYNDINYTLVKDNGDLILKVVSPYTPPAAPSVSADITAITNRDVTVTAVFAHDSVKNEYSLNGGAWKTYTNGIVFTDNGSVSFRSTSNKGVYSDITSYTVTNIDKIAPDKPVISFSTSELTNGTVTVSASFSSDSLSREYSLDNKVWQSYNSGVVMSDNGTVYFRGCDEAGNYSQVASYTVSNIDRTAPVKPTAYADITTPTKGNVSVFATFAQDSAKNEYSTDNSKWNIYENGVEMTQNGTVYFRSTDAAGNISSVTEFVVGNIDRIAPGKPVVSADTTAVTNKDVVLTAVFDDDAVKNEYSFDGKNWQNCTGKVVCPQNGKVYFRSTDAAGNVSGVTGFDVTNIDKTAPEQPQLSADVTTLTNKDVTITAIFSEDSVLQEYSFDNQNWFTYTGGVNAAANGKVYFRGVDEAGNASAETFYEVTNIDKTAPEAPLASADITDVTRLNVTVTATFAADSVLDQYSVNGGAWTTYSGGVLVTANGKVTFRSTDEAGNISETVYTVSNIDRIAPNLPEVKLSTTVLTNKDVTVTAIFAADSVLNEYSVNGGEWQIYDGGIVFSENGEIAFRSTDEAGNVSRERVYKVSNINKNLPEVPEQSEYCFVKKSYSSKINGKTQDGIRLKWQTNAVNSLDDVPEGMIAVLLDSKNTLTAIPDGIETIAGKAEILTINKTDYKASFSAAGTLNLNGIDTGDVEFIRFATVNVTDGAVVGDIAGGKENISETVKTSLKNGIATKTVTYKQTVTASGKVTVTDATAGNISGYSTVTLDNGKAGELVNSNVKISKSDKTVGGKDDTITHTTTYSASGTATLKNGSYVDSISGFKTVKLIASTVGEIALGDSYTEKFTLKKGVETPSLKETYTGTVTLENSTVGSVVGMNKVTASKGFNAIASYTGSDGNDTLTINKNAVLALGAVDMGAGAKDKFVNNGTLVLTGDFDRSFISGKGEIVAASDVYETLENQNGVLDLGATAEGFRTTKHENSDDTLKKAVKWDLKAGDYTGWLGSWQSGSDNVDFIKFTIGKNDVDKELSVSGVENFTLFDKKGNEVDIISAAGTYTLKLELDDTESTSYTLALA